ncbi:MAG TPA: flavodoxin [Fusobacterium sp.]|uniref:flavodoxin n=1 Tax=Fusobacterium sp. TaxID=68766 RepID=UPI002F40ACAE
MKIALVYRSTTGRTEAMAKAIEEGILAAGGAVNVSSIEDVNVEDVFASDILVLGSSADGAESIDETNFVPFMEENKEKFSGKKVFLFGSYGWGGGEYANTWKDQILEFGGEMIEEPITCLEDPEEAILEQLREAGKKIAAL